MSQRKQNQGKSSVEDPLLDRRSSRPPILTGYTYDPREAYRARDDHRLLAIRLETNRACNLQCRYCYADSGGSLAHEMGYDTLIDIIHQARDLGAESIVIIGGGEPTLHPHFMNLVEKIHSLGMIPVVFSNCLKIDAPLAEFLYVHNASVMGKLDSLRENVQDYLAGVSGAGTRIRRGLDCLMNAGFADGNDPKRLRLGVSFVTCRMNLGEIETIWTFCRERNLFPNMEVLTPTGRGKEQLPGEGLTTEEVQAYKFRLLKLDRTTYGLDWLPYTPLAASGCLQHLYSLYVTIEGNVRPCAPVKFDEHPDLKHDGRYPYNVLRATLGEIYHDPLFTYVRHIDHYLEGKCHHCEHLDECIGCRGYAYAVGVNAGKDPRAALRSECLQCAKGK